MGSVDRKGESQQRQLVLRIGGRKVIGVGPAEDLALHDLETKARHAHDFLEQGDKVQVAVVFKGREMAHQEIGETLMKKFMRRITVMA